MASHADENEDEEGDSKPPRFPTAGNDIAWLSYRLLIEFHPPIRMSRKLGHDFTKQIFSAMESGSTEIESNEWVLRGAGVYDGMILRVEKDKVLLSVIQPENSEEWYLERFEHILDEFKRAFDPSIVLTSVATANGLLQVDGDARSFLGGNLMLMHPRKLAAFPCPLHILGVRLYFPSGDAEDDTWGVDVKAESWMEDPTKLYIEAEADWQGVEPWDDNTPHAQCHHVNTVREFMKTKLLDFLHQPPLPGIDGRTEPEDDELDDDEEQGNGN